MFLESHSMQIFYGSMKNGMSPIVVIVTYWKQCHFPLNQYKEKLYSSFTGHTWDSFLTKWLQLFERLMLFFIHSNQMLPWNLENFGISRLTKCKKIRALWGYGLKIPKKKTWGRVVNLFPKRREFQIQSFGVLDFFSIHPWWKFTHGW